MTTATQAKTEFMRTYLPCFYDLPVLDAANILGVVESTVRVHKLARGIRSWPFAAIRHNTFSMDWAEIERIRADALQETTGEFHDILLAAATMGARMRRIHEKTSTNNSRPIKKQLIDTGVQALSDKEEVPAPPAITVITRDPQEFAHLDDPGFFYTLKYEDDRFITPWTEDEIREMQGLPALDAWGGRLLN